MTQIPMKNTDQPIVTREDQFADYLARGLTMIEIRERMSLTNPAAQGLMTRIRAKLGKDQAK